MYIIWTKPDGSKVQTALSEGIDAASHATKLQASGSIDPAWTFVASNTPLPKSPVSNPAIAVIDAQLAALDMKRIRPTAEGDTAYLAILNAQAAALRAERALLPATVQP